MKYLLQKTFENEFNNTNYKNFVINLFNRFDFSKEHSLKHQFNEAERQALEDFMFLGTFDDIEKKKLDVLTVELKGGSKVERARSLQRNLIGKYLKTNLNDAALVAFYSTDNPDWRLSFVKMEYKITDRGTKVDIGTPPKRYSFLVGKTEPSHTAQKQLIDLLDDKKLPTIEALEKAFSIEKVTKEFYSQVALMFTELVGGERKIGAKKISEKGSLKLPYIDDDTVKKEFAVRLIGRLLFCWFLKKKKPDRGEPLIPSKVLSSNAIMMYPNYYHSLLEPLFFQVLNTPIDKRNKRVSNILWNKIPFLNGGLFEPHQHDFYDIDDLGTSKYLNTLKVPDDWFLDLFKIFELYNFTIDESTSIDVEISVDPEMLGRIFENLLAEINPETGETARKATGSYYTPRPIVEYMVDESLKQYLKTKTDINEDKLSKLLSYAEDNTGITEQEKELVIDALDTLKIIDPACGSGAFPMGILHKMLLILQKIDPKSTQWLSRKLSHIENKVIRDEIERKLKRENWDYIHKLGIIQNSIYGVDIQPIAVEISKLRFFLSLIVDEMIDDNKTNRGIEALPNLEFKFVTANSLIGLPKSEQGFAESHRDIEKLRELREEYFTSYGIEKRRIEKEFKETQDRMFRHALNWQTTKSQTFKLSSWNPFSDDASSWFDPEWMFGVRDSFDVVIANPPYIGEANHKEIFEPLKKTSLGVRFYMGKMDIYYFFFHLALDLSRDNGLVYFITTNYYTTAYGAKKLRRDFKERASILSLIDFNELRIFESALGQHNMLTFLRKGNNDSQVLFSRTKRKGFADAEILNKILSKSDSETENFTLEQKNVFHGDDLLLGISRSVNNLIHEIITKVEKKGDYSFQDAEIGSGIDVCQEAVIKSHLKKLPTLSIGEGIFVLTDDELNRLSLSQKELSIIKPFYTTKEFTNYGSISVNKHWIIYTTTSTIKHIDEYPKIKTHLDRFKKINTSDNKPYGLHRAREESFFKGGKLLCLRMTKKPQISFVDFDCYVSRPFLIVKPTNNSLNLKYLTALLNSKLFYFWFYHRGKRKGEQLQIDKGPLLRVPIKTVPLTYQKPFIEKVDQILSIIREDDYLENPDKQIKVSALEHQIDKMVYELYELTPEEIEIIETSK